MCFNYTMQILLGLSQSVHWFNESSVITPTTANQINDYNQGVLFNPQYIFWQYLTVRLWKSNTKASPQEIKLVDHSKPKPQVLVTWNN